MQTLKFRQLAITVAAAAAVFTMAGQGTARAQVTVAGNASSTTPLIGGLTYAPGSFNVVTAGGFAGIGTAPGSTDTLGSFSLAPTNTTYTGQTFILNVDFTAPAGTTPDPINVNALLEGAVTSAGAGGVFVDFDNSLRTINYNTGTTFGSFQFSVNDLTLTPGAAGAVSIVPVTGNIRAATSNPVPEMSTVVGLGSMLMGGGFTLFGGVIRRRRKGGLAAA